MSAPPFNSAAEISAFEDLPHDDPGVCALRAVKHDRQIRDVERTSETRKYFCYAPFGRTRRIYERDRRTTRLLDAAKVVQQQYRLLSSQRESTSLTGAIVHTALEVSNRESGRGVRCGSLWSWAFQDRSVARSCISAWGTVARTSDPQASRDRRLNDRPMERMPRLRVFRRVPT